MPNFPITLPEKVMLCVKTFQRETLIPTHTAAAVCLCAVAGLDVRTASPASYPHNHMSSEFFCNSFSLPGTPSRVYLEQWGA
eukprot:1784199-Amphidinium_carterae.1